LENSFKKCTKCKAILPFESFYKNKNSKDGLTSQCKKCLLNYEKEYQKKHPGEQKIRRKKWHEANREYENLVNKKRNRNNKEKVKLNSKKWKLTHKDKIKEYYKSRKIHDITENEYELIFSYCAGKCMYCGMSEEESQIVFGQKLHKDHAINDGSGGIENCILACKGCNSSKHADDWNIWYTPENPVFSEERFYAIKYWLNLFNKE
jgi:hypothetical protein